MKLTMQDGVLTIKTPCKINPYLEVLKKRADGFHDLDSVMIAVDLHDELVFESTSERDFRLTIEPNSAWIGDQIGYNGNRLGKLEDNLVYRALELVANALDVHQGMDLRLRKSIPVQSGLGGGSSDAAAALVAAQVLWTGKYDEQLTRQLAAKLGSDVNFFIEGYSQDAWVARCLGRGEIVNPFRLNNFCSWVLVFPTNIQCSTAKVFQNLSIGDQAKTPSDRLTERYQEIDWVTKSSFDGLLFNRLYQASEDIYPEIANFYSRLEAIEPSVKFVMSGSGSSFVAPCRREFASQLSKTVSSAMECNTYVGEFWKTKSIETQVNDLSIS